MRIRAIATAQAAEGLRRWSRWEEGGRIVLTRGVWRPPADVGAFQKGRLKKILSEPRGGPLDSDDRRLQFIAPWPVLRAAGQIRARSLDVGGQTADAQADLVTTPSCDHRPKLGFHRDALPG